MPGVAEVSGAREVPGAPEPPVAPWPPAAPEPPRSAGAAQGRAHARRAQRGGRRPWSLRTRLVVSAVALIAVVCAVIGTVTTLALQSYLQGQVDDDLRASVGRFLNKPGPARELPRDDVLFVASPGQPIGTVGARIGQDGEISMSGKSNDSPMTNDMDLEGRVDSLTSGQRKALAAVPLDGQVHTIDLPGLGGYRVVAQWDHREGGIILAFPLDQTQETVNTLILVEFCVAAAGLVAAGIAGAAMVGISLRPLRRVAATATRVSELPLHSGEVALRERVPASEADPRTEVGQVGAALNRMLGHVESALAARQESETRVRQFVADASHELRTPLASIRGYAELTRRGREEIGPDTRHALGRVESEAGRMTGLVEDLLLLARLDAGRPLECAEVDLSPLVVDAVSDARAVGSDHEWRLELPDEPAVVHGDDARLHQVLVNLLANARTHTPAGTTVTARVLWGGPQAASSYPSPYPAPYGLSYGVSAGMSPGTGGPRGHRKGGGSPYAPPYGSPYAAARAAAGAFGPPQPPSYVSLEIEDDGPGIPPELLPHVFERFARGDASRSRGAGSTGLGLAIVHAVVAAHDGQVTVDSVPGRTVFGVHLPVHLPVHRGVHHGVHQAVTDSQAGHRLTTQP
ncbi:HAMP domain-containing sensor histidine kinase [Streptomyces sp. 11-1-2]|uniref:sensor histidine kinase n=1 Tax=unclassified Streptomyces TaxID=2593676 RepID=UPI001F08D351|nr:HAMP domain-containing sensor histidine kinase [Streptomyces sp. 11-1-2]